MDMHVYSIGSNFKEVSFDRFYVPTEVNGEPGIGLISREKVDAHAALYAYETPDDAIYSSDPYSLLKSFVPGGGLPQKKIAPIPALVAEGLRDVFSVDTKEHNKMILKVFGEDFALELVGLMSKTGYSAFTARKVIDSLESWGKPVQVTYEHFNILLDAMKKHTPLLQKKLD